MVDVDVLFDEAFEILKMSETCEMEINKQDCCNNVNIVQDCANGNFVCINCGVVQEHSIIDHSAEWNFSAEDAMFSKDPSRCGCPINPLLEKSSMATSIQRTKGNKNWLMLKLHQQNSMDYVERARYHVFEKIARMASRQELPSSIVEHAKSMYKKISEMKLSRGNVRLGLLGCCIMHACANAKVPRSSKEIADMCEIDVSILNNASKVFNTLIEPKDEESFICPNDLIIRFSNCLGLPKEVEKQLVKQVRQYSCLIEESIVLIGKTPNAITSGLIFIALNKIQHGKINKKFICQQHQVSIVTLNKIVQTLNQIIPENEK